MQEINTICKFRIYINAEYCVYKNIKRLAFGFSATFTFLFGVLFSEWESDSDSDSYSDSDSIFLSSPFLSDNTLFFLRLPLFAGEEGTCERLIKSVALEFM